MNIKKIENSKKDIIRLLNIYYKNKINCPTQFIEDMFELLYASYYEQYYDRNYHKVSKKMDDIINSLAQLKTMMSSETYNKKEKKKQLLKIKASVKKIDKYVDKNKKYKNSDMNIVTNDERVKNELDIMFEMQNNNSYNEIILPKKIITKISSLLQKRGIDEKTSIKFSNYFVKEYNDYISNYIKKRNNKYEKNYEYSYRLGSDNE